MLRLNALQGDALSTNRTGDQKCAGLDPIWDNVVLGALQFLHSFDDDSSRARTFDFRAHLVEEIGEIAYFRLGCCPFDDGAAIRQYSSHHDVVRSQDGWTEFPSQINYCAGQLRREDFH